MCFSLWMYRYIFVDLSILVIELCMNKYESNYHIRMDLNMLV
jgi:hypothetical protein